MTNEEQNNEQINELAKTFKALMKAQISGLILGKERAIIDLIMVYECENKEANLSTSFISETLSISAVLSFLVYFP